MDYAQQKKSGLIPLSPSQTPKSSDRPSRDLRDSSNPSSGKGDGGKERGVNVQVIVRCRPLSEDESRANTPVVIACNESRREVSAAQIIASKQIDRTFAFDKVFGPSSRQKDLYNQAVSPIVYEVLEGYNCTIFAYGQTGTGKTYTMEGGGRKAKNGDFPSDAGVIPRAVRQIFDILEEQCAEYSMKVTFLELYNEEITDLLAPEETSKFLDDKAKKPIALMEDGKGGVFVRGLEEEMVSTANEIYKILDKGSSKRRTAETLLNKQSSRSHSIFSITIHIKECTPEGEEMIKCGKLNLVDLAGSENISRSGAREGRAREAGEINKSLLTLGRVINALVEHSGHIPYRDSKLTRLLRDSLGGKTKTCIIATISPSVYCLEETLSTLDYAHRAKNIKNKPEVNQKMMKIALMKDLYGEIERLKQEVFAAREKNGIYVPRDRFLQEEAEKKAMAEKIERMELEFESKDKQHLALQELFDSQQQLNADLSDKLGKTERRLEDTERILSEVEEKYRQANNKIREKEFLIATLLKSEKALTERAFELHSELESAASDVSSLFAKIERKDKIEDANRSLVQKFQSQLTQQLDLLHRTVSASVTDQESHLKGMEEDMHAFVSTKAEATEVLRDKVGKLQSIYGLGIKALDELSGELDGSSCLTLRKLNSEVSKHSSALEDLFKNISVEADTVLNELQTCLSKQEEKLSSYALQQREGYNRAMETARCISGVNDNFFKTLDNHAATLEKIIEDSQAMNNRKLYELEKKFEECAANEEKLMLQKVAEMLATSNARKKKLVQMTVNDLRESATNTTVNLQGEMSTVKHFTSSVKDQWASYMVDAENHYLEDTSKVESGKETLQEGLRECMAKTSTSAHQWRSAEEALLNLEKGNVASVDSIVSGGIAASQLLRNRVTSSATAVFEDLDVANKSLLSSVENSLKLDHEACSNMDSMIAPCCEEMRELKGGHYHKIAEVTSNVEKRLGQEYKVDEPSCSTPKRRTFNLPGTSSIEELRTPPFEELLKLFWDAKSGKHVNGEAKQFSGAQDNQSPSLRDSRLPLTALN